MAIKKTSTIRVSTEGKVPLGAKVKTKTRLKNPLKKLAKPRVKASAKRVAVRPLSPPFRIPKSLKPHHALLSAATFASRKHFGQARGDGLTPYFSHIARVSLILSHVFGIRDDRMLTAAMLHDTIEDTDTDYDEIEALFGAEVATYVVALTKNSMQPKDLREEDYQRRLCAAPEEVRIIKLADIYDNVSYRHQSTKIARTLASAERLLAAFEKLITTPVGKSAYEKVAKLVTEVRKRAH